MKLGLSTYSFPWTFSDLSPTMSPLKALCSLIIFAAQHNISNVQIGDNCPLHSLTTNELEELANFATANSVNLVPGARRMTVENLHAYLDIAVTLNSPYVRIVIDDADYHPDENEVKNIIHQALPAFKKQNVRIAIENHDRFPSKTLKNIIEETDAHWVGICLDTANSLGAGEGIEHVMHHLAPYTLNLHIKDFSIKRLDHKMGFRISGCAAGEGMLNIPAMLKELSNYPACTVATLEVWSDRKETMKQTIDNENDWVNKSISYLKTMIT